MKEQSSNPCEKVSFILTYDQLEAAYNIYQEQFISCDFIRRSLERLEEGIGLCNLPYETLHDDPNLLHEAYYIWCLYLFKILHLFFYYEFNLLFQILPAAKPNRSTLL